MKIVGDSIKISENSLSPDITKLKVGGRIKARISSKSGSNQAVIDIGGSRFKADFINGFPDRDEINLILESKQNGIIHFKLLGNHQKQENLDELFSFTILNIKDFQKSSYYELKKSIREGIVSIFDLNKIILGIPDKDVNYNKIVNIFNLLLARNMKYENLFFISSLLNSSSGNLKQLLSILSIFFQDTFKESYDSFNKLFKNSNYIELINNFFNRIDTDLNPDEKNEVLKNLIEILISDSGRQNSGSGEIIFFENKKFRLCRYLIQNKNILISFSLSFLGDIDIIIKENKHDFIISFFSESEAVYELKHQIDELKNNLNKYFKKNIQVAFYSRKGSIEKIIEIISFIDLEYRLDLKA